MATRGSAPSVRMDPDARVVDHLGRESEGVGMAEDRFGRAVSVASGLVEGTCETLGADVADDVHDPLVWGAVVLRAGRDPVLGAKLAGAHGRWIDRDVAIPAEDEEGLRRLFVASRVAEAAGGEA